MFEDSRCFAVGALVSKHHCDAAKTFGSRRHNTQGLATLGLAARPCHGISMPCCLPEIFLLVSGTREVQLRVP